MKRIARSASLLAVALGIAITPISGVKYVSQ